MRARLLVIVLFLVGLLAAGLGVPLAVSDAQAAQLRMFTVRLTDTIFYASLAERPLVAADATGLAAELHRYEETIGGAVIVYDRAGNIVASSHMPPPVLDDEALERVQVAAAGRPSAPYPLLVPWDGRPMVLAEPVLVDSEVRGVAVTISPTDALHAAEWSSWLVITAAGVLSLGLAVLVALPIVRWILRPVERLDEGTGRVAAAVLAGGVPEPVSDNSGPPELRRLTASFDRMADTVSQAYAAQRAFVADASHQLRNPLTALRLRLSNLEGQVVPDAIEDHLAALEEADRLSTLLDGLLAMARAERTAPLRMLDLNQEVDDRVEVWRPLAEHLELRLEITGTRGLQVLAPEGTIDAVLDAVLDNAMKFAPPGSAITVSTTATETEVALAVRDRGPGMAPDDLERATGRFWRSPGQSNVEGSGLGLAIAARTVEVGGGALTLDLPEGGGLRVTARLPRVEVPAPEPPTQP